MISVEVMLRADTRFEAAVRRVMMARIANAKAPRGELLVEHPVFLNPFKGRVGGQQILTLRQASNREADGVNHTEPEFVLQAVDEIKVRVPKTNGRRLELLVLHDS